MEKNSLQEVVRQLPATPGVYQFFNADQTLIYVGKAKNILKRVSSYFSKSSTLNKKTRRLVSEISKIEYIVSNTEFDALLLENNLQQSAKQTEQNLIKMAHERSSWQKHSARMGGCAQTVARAAAEMSPIANTKGDCTFPDASQARHVKRQPCLHS